MTDLGATAGVGQRIQSARRRRGIRSAAELAASIPGNVVTAATLQNIEAGRKIDISVSQILNIAHALQIAPIYLLADIKDPNSVLDLPGLSDDVKQMPAVEFDAWISGGLGGAFEWSSSNDQSERTQLAALRELELLRREQSRLTLLIDASSNLALGTDSELGVEAFSQKLADTENQIKRLADFLFSAGWDVSRWRHSSKR